MTHYDGLYIRILQVTWLQSGTWRTLCFLWGSTGLILCTFLIAIWEQVKHKVCRAWEFRAVNWCVFRLHILEDEVETSSCFELIGSDHLFIATQTVLVATFWHSLKMIPERIISISCSNGVVDELFFVVQDRYRTKIFKKRAGRKVMLETMMICWT